MPPIACSCNLLSSSCRSKLHRSSQPCPYNLFSSGCKGEFRRSSSFTTCSAQVVRHVPQLVLLQLVKLKLSGCASPFSWPRPLLLPRGLSCRLCAVGFVRPFVLHNAYFWILCCNLGTETHLWASCPIFASRVFAYRLGGFVSWLSLLAIPYHVIA